MPGGVPPPQIVIHGGYGPSDAPIVRAAAARWHISAETLWGVYGTETSFGHNVHRSSAGAEGPFQFIPATAKSYGVDVTNFSSSAFGAAHYLHDLGADTDPDSEATHRALDKYSGGGGADYIGNVKENGGKLGTLAGTPINPGKIVNGVVDAATAVPKFLGKLDVIFDPAWWLRVAMVLGGIIALAAGLVFIGKDFTPLGAVTKLAKGKA